MIGMENDIMKRIEWTWPNGKKSYSVAFSDENADRQIDSVLYWIEQDSLYDKVSVKLIDASEAPRHSCPEFHRAE